VRLERPRRKLKPTAAQSLLKKQGLLARLYHQAAPLERRVR